MLKNKPVIGLLHVLFWSVYILINSLIYMNFYESENVKILPNGQEVVERVTFPETFHISLKSQVVELPGKFLLVYLNLLLLLPNLLLRQKYLQYFLALVASFVLVAVVQRLFSVYVTFPLLFPNATLVPDIFSLARFLQYAAGAFSLMVFTSAIRIIIVWQQNQKKTQELEKRQLSTELQLLKTQLNPHFFFNTLNNLYGLAMENSQHTASMIMRLSEMMNYILYESNSKTVPLTKEIAALKNYIQLEKTRYGDRVQVSFNVKGNPDKISIPPMLILPFVENAFKHGVSQETTQAWMNISVSAEPNDFSFQIENSKAGHQLNGSVNHGIGLENVRRRLVLLYPEAHELKFFDEKETFLVVLNLKTKL